MKATFFRIIEAEDKAAALRETLRGANRRDQFHVDPASFRAIPSSPFAYWVSEELRNLFISLPALSAEGRIAASGGKTLDDFRWIRAAWEFANSDSQDWVGFAKGGAFSRFYSDVHLTLDWRNGARSLKQYLVHYRSSRGWSPNWTAELHGSEHYFRPGLTWPRRTTSGLSIRAMPAGCIFADKGPAAFVEGGDPQTLLALLAVVNSAPFRALVELQLAAADAAARSYEVGVLQRTPLPDLTGAAETLNPAP